MRGPRSWRRALVLSAAVLAGIGLIAAGLIWYYDDLPRRQVERTLERRLAAEVDLGSLSVEGLHDFVLKDLTVRKMAGQPRLDYLRIGTLYVSGSLRDILNARFESLRGVDVEARLVPPPPPERAPAAAPAEPIQVEAGRLEIQNVRILLGTDGLARGAHRDQVGGEAAPGRGDGGRANRVEGRGGGDVTRGEEGGREPDDVIFEGHAVLTNLGRGLEGEVILESPQVRLESLVAFVFGRETASSWAGAVAADPSSPSGQVPRATRKGTEEASGVGESAPDRGAPPGGSVSSRTSRSNGIAVAQSVRHDPLSAVAVNPSRAPDSGVDRVRHGVPASPESRPPGGAITRIQVTARFKEKGESAAVDVRARDMTLASAGQSITIPDPALTAEMRSDGAGKPLRIDARAKLTILDSGSASVVLDASSGSLLESRVEIRGLDLAPVALLTGQLAGGWQAEGKADLTVSGSGPLQDCDLDVRLARLATSVEGSNKGGVSPERALELREATLHARGRIPITALLGGTANSPNALSGGGAVPGAPAPPGAHALHGGVGANGAQARHAGGASNSPTLSGFGTPNGAHASSRGGAVNRGNALSRSATESNAQPLSGGGATNGPLDPHSGTLQADLEVGSLRGSFRGSALPAQLSPLRGRMDGTFAAGEDLRFEGRASLGAPAIGRLEIEGSAWMSPAETPAGAVRASMVNPASAPADPSRSLPSADLRWTWTGLDLAGLLPLVEAAGITLPSQLQARGTGTARGTLAGPLTSPLVKGALDISRLDVAGYPQAGDAAPASNPAPDNAATAVHSAPGNAAAVPKPAPGDAAAAVHSTPGAAHRPAWALHDGRLQAEFQWQTPTGPIVIGGAALGGDLLVGQLEKTRLTLSARGRVDPFQGDAEMSEALIESPGLLRARLEGRGKLWPNGPPPGARSDSATPRGNRSGAPSGRTSPDASPGGGSEGSEGEQRASLALHLEEADLSKWRVLLQPILGDPVAGYSLKGRAAAELAGTLGDNGSWSGKGKATLTKTGFASEDGSQVLEGLDTSWDLALDGNLEDGSAKARGSAKVGGFQLLWGSFFADGTSLPSTLDLQASLSAAPPAPSKPIGNEGSAALPAQSRPTGNGRSAAPSSHAPTTHAPSSPIASSIDHSVSSGWSWKGTASWTFPDGPRVDASCDAVAGSPLRYTLAAKIDDLASTVKRYVRDPLGDSAPFFQKVTAAGSLRVETNGSLSERERTVQGRLQLENGGVSGTEKNADFEGLQLDLPWDLAWGPPGPDGARPIRGGERKGTVRFSRLELGGLEIPAATTGLRVAADSVTFEEGLAVNLLGGVLGLERLKAVDLLRPTRHLETGIVAAQMSLDEASRTFALPVLSGTADAYFPRVVLSMKNLRVDGGGTISLFGGQVEVHDISGEDILSRYPKIAFSAEFREIDLGQVTRTFDFGEITGIAQGHVRNCELFRGVPVAFEALFETVDRKDVPRTVNVKAIKNLTILGTGTSTNIFDKGIQKFFDKYTYSRIGVFTTLKDDVFVLRGLEHRAGQELFVKGRLPFPINVVNAQPGAPISFQDMLERLENLDLGGATIER